MGEHDVARNAGATVRWADVPVRLALVALVLYWSFLLLRPLLAVLVWAMILSVALYPAYRWLERALGSHRTLASFLLTVSAFIMILGPFGIIGTALVENLSSISAGIAEGRITVPPPPSYVAEWPIIGSRLSAAWEAAAADLGPAIASLAPQLREVARTLLLVLGNIGIGMLEFAAALLIAAFTYSRAAHLHESIKRFALRIAPGVGADLVDIAGGTVRSVARGIVGISLLQAILFGIGTIIVGIPLAGLWTFIALILSVVQIGLGLVTIPIIIYAWTVMDTMNAAIFTVYMVAVTLVDNVLKPIFFAIGLPVPMPVIFIGVIGGLLAHGLIGLFVGPIILAFGYELARAWLEQTDSPGDP